MPYMASGASRAPAELRYQGLLPRHFVAKAQIVGQPQSATVLGAEHGHTDEPVGPAYVIAPLQAAVLVLLGPQSLLRGVALIIARDGHWDSRTKLSLLALRENDQARRKLSCLPRSDLIRRPLKLPRAF